MAVYHERTDPLSCATIIERMHANGFCEIDINWPRGKSLPSIGDVLAIHSEDHSIRMLTWIRHTEIGESNSKTHTFRLRVSVGTRTLQRAAF